MFEKHLWRLITKTIMPNLWQFCILALFPMLFCEASLTTTSKQSKLSECPGKPLYQRELVDCVVTPPRHVNIICQSWNNVEIRVQKTEYDKLPKSMQRLTILCQRGNPFFLDTSKLNWHNWAPQNQVYEITYGNQLSIEEISPGIYNRHGFSVKIVLPSISEAVEREVYHFNTQNEKGTPKNLTTFTLFINQNQTEGISPRNEPIIDSKQSQNLLIEFKENSSVSCTTSSQNQEIHKLYSVYFTNTSESQIYMNCLQKSNVETCTKNPICQGNDPSLNCKDRIISCASNSDVNKTSCKLEKVHKSGVIVCATKDEQEKDFVEFFTALDGVKYRYDDSHTLAIDKLVKVNLVNRSRLFYPGQWVTVDYETVSYRTKDPIYWEYKLKDGHLGSFVYGEERDNLQEGKVKLKMKKGMQKILYFVPWSPYPIGSAVNVLVTDKKAPDTYRVKVNESKIEILGTVGKELHLICDVKGNPLPQIKWTRGDNSEIVSPSPRLDILKSFYDEEITSILRFKSFTEDDEGKYTCTASGASTASNSEGIKEITWKVGVNSGIGYEAAVGIVLILIAIILVGTICYQIWFPPVADEVKF